MCFVKKLLYSLYLYVISLKSEYVHFFHSRNDVANTDLPNTTIKKIISRIRRLTFHKPRRILT